MLDQRGRLLRAALGFAGCSLPSYDRALWALRTWLDSWRGIGHFAVGMHHPGYDVQLTQYDESGRSQNGVGVVKVAVVKFYARRSTYNDHERKTYLPMDVALARFPLRSYRRGSDRAPYS